MKKELKEAIVGWLFENENKWQRTNSCIKEFRSYIYNDKGEYLIGGKDVSDFISKVDKLIYD